VSNSPDEFERLNERLHVNCQRPSGEIRIRVKRICWRKYRQWYLTLCTAPLSKVACIVSIPSRSKSQLQCCTTKRVDYIYSVSRTCKPGTSSSKTISKTYQVRPHPRHLIFATQVPAGSQTHTHTHTNGSSQIDMSQCSAHMRSDRSLTMTATWVSVFTTMQPPRRTLRR
jgi:hypothetical protein